MNTYLSNKLKILSLIAMVLVVFIHSYIEITINNTLISQSIDFLQYFISQGVARVAVPIFFYNFRLPLFLILQKHSK